MEPGEPGERQITIEIDGRSVSLPNVAICLVTDDRVELSASDANRAAGLTVSWRADQPPDQTNIIWVEPAAGGAVAAGPVVSGGTPPEVRVSGHTVELVTEVHDQLGVGPSQQLRIRAGCAEAAPTEPDVPVPPAGAVGRASFTVDGHELVFELGEVCEISTATASVALTDADGSSFGLVMMGESGFLTVTLAGGQQWTAGLSGEALQPQVSGSSAAWSGTATDGYSQRKAQAMFSVECAS